MIFHSPPDIFDVSCESCFTGEGLLVKHLGIYYFLPFGLKLGSKFLRNVLTSQVFVDFSG